VPTSYSVEVSSSTSSAPYRFLNPVNTNRIKRPLPINPTTRSETSTVTIPFFNLPTTRGDDTANAVASSSAIPSQPSQNQQNQSSDEYQNMTYGSGKPSWSRGGDIEDGNSGLNRRNNASGNGGGGSYQRGEGAGSNYQPPQVKGTYAEQQTHVVEDTLRTHVQASIAFFFTFVDL